MREHENNLSFSVTDPRMNLEGIRRMLMDFVFSLVCFLSMFKFRRNIAYKIQRCSNSSSSETPAWFNILLRVVFLTGSCNGTITVESPFCINTWLPFCRTMIKPILFRDLIIFLPDTEGSLGTCHFHPKDFSIRPRLFL